MTARRWRLTPRAERTLAEIAAWTDDRFGRRQAERYRSEVIARLDALARNDLPGQDCSVLAGEMAGALRFIRAGSHFAIYAEIDDEIVVIDLVHGRADLPSRLRALRP